MSDNISFPPQSPVTTDVINIISGTTVTPYPSYASDSDQQAAYNAIVAYLGIGDLRLAYQNLDLDLNSSYTNLVSMAAPSGISPDDWNTVYGEIKSEMQAVLNVRQLFSNSSTFIINVFLSDSMLVSQVADNVSSIEGDTSIFMSMMGVWGDVLWAVTSFVGEEAAPIVNTLAALVSLCGAAGSISDVQVDYSGLDAALGVQFNAVLGVNGKAATAAITDWGKTQQIDALITGEQLVWPMDSSQAVLYATNAYKLRLYQAMLPLVWQVYAGYQYSSDTSDPSQSSCDCVAMIEGYHWADQQDPDYNATKNYRTYWIGEPNPNGNPNAACQAVFAPVAQGGLGASKNDAMLNGGNWMFEQQLAEYTPSCVSKS